MSSVIKKNYLTFTEARKFGSDSKDFNTNKIQTLDLVIQELNTTFINMIEDIKENMVLISEQIRNLSKEIKAVKKNGNSRMETWNS